MSYTALKNWRFETETFNTPEEFFNPFINTNNTLATRAKFRTILKGLAKVLPPELVKEEMLSKWQYAGVDEAYPLHQFGARIIEKLFERDNIHLYIWFGLSIQPASTRNTYDSLLLDLTFPRPEGDLFWFDITTRVFQDCLNSDITEVCELIEEYVNQTWSRYINPLDPDSSYQDRTMSVHDAALIRQSRLKMIWNNHFPSFYIARRHEYQDGTTEDLPPVLIRDLIRPTSATEVKCEVQHWDNYRHTPKVTLVFKIVGTASRARLYRVHNYSQDITRLLPNVLRHPKQTIAPLYGVELEVSTDTDVQSIIDAPDEVYCAIKSDASISGSKSGAFEIVSAPATIKTHKKAWAQIFDKIGYDPFDCTKDTNNGMHIHVDMQALQPSEEDYIHSQHLKNFIWFFTNPVNAAFHLSVSERTQDSMNRWAPLPQFLPGRKLPYYYRHLFTYVLPPYRGIINFKQGREEQYVTLEVRAFKGIVSLAEVIKNLEFVDSVFYFTHKTSFLSNTVENYLRFLEGTNTNRYATLKTFIDRLDIQPIMERARIQQLVFNTTDPDQVIRLMNRSFPQITPTHVQVLNDLFQTAKFGLADHRLVVTETNRSRIRDLDLALANKLTYAKKRSQAACAS